MDQEKETAAYHLIDAFIKNGSDTFFGIPGGPVSPVFDAILRHPKARLIESRHETSAVFAAIGFNRATGKIPIIVVTSGPGALNAVTGIASAWAEKVPLVLISGDVSWEKSGGKLLQDSGSEGIDLDKVFSDITESCIRALKAETVVSQGIASLYNARRTSSPTLFIIPINRAMTKVNNIDIIFESDHNLDIILQNVSRSLIYAKRPLIVVGSGCRKHVDIIHDLIEQLNIPFVTTPRAKGLISELHSMSLRHGGLGASMWARQYTSDGVDVALVLGTDLDDCSIGPTEYIQPNGELIHVDLDSTVFNRNLSTKIGIIGDIGSIAKRIVETAKDWGFFHPYTNELIEKIKESSAFGVEDFRSDESSKITPHRAIADIEAVFGRQARYVTDIGEHMLFALHFLTAQSPDDFTIHLGLGSMGSGIGSSIGLALGDKTRGVVCICGDGGMQMSGMEALVAIRENLPIVFTVFNDNRYNMVYHGHKFVFGKKHAWDTHPIDFVKWANSIGMKATRIDSPGQITSDLIMNLSNGNQPILLDIHIDGDVKFQGGGRNESLQHMSQPKE